MKKPDGMATEQSEVTDAKPFHDKSMRNREDPSQHDNGCP